MIRHLFAFCSCFLASFSFAADSSLVQSAISGETPDQWVTLFQLNASDPQGLRAALAESLGAKSESEIENEALRQDSIASLHVLRALYAVDANLRAERLFRPGLLGKAPPNPNPDSASFYVALLAEVYAQRNGGPVIAADALTIPRARTARESAEGDFLRLPIAQLLHFRKGPRGYEDMPAHAAVFFDVGLQDGVRHLDAHASPIGFTRTLERALTVLVLSHRFTLSNPEGLGKTLSAEGKANARTRLAEIAEQRPKEPIAFLVTDAARYGVVYFSAPLKRVEAPSQTTSPLATVSIEQALNLIDSRNSGTRALGWAALEASLRSRTSAVSEAQELQIERRALAEETSSAYRALLQLASISPATQKRWLSQWLAGGEQAGTVLSLLTALDALKLSDEGKAAFVPRDPEQSVLRKLLIAMPVTLFSEEEILWMKRTLEGPSSRQTTLLAQSLARAPELAARLGISAGALLRGCGNPESRSALDGLLDAHCRQRVFAARSAATPSPWNDVTLKAILEDTGSVPADFLTLREEPTDLGHLESALHPVGGKFRGKATTKETIPDTDDRGTFYNHIQEDITSEITVRASQRFPNQDLRKWGFDASFDCFGGSNRLEAVVGSCYKAIHDTKILTELGRVAVHRFGVRHHSWQPLNPDSKAPKFEPAWSLRVGYRPSPETNWIAFRADDCRGRTNVMGKGLMTVGGTTLSEPGTGWQVSAVVPGVTLQLRFELCGKAQETRVVAGTPTVGLVGDSEATLEILELDPQTARRFSFIDLVRPATPAERGGLLSYVASAQRGLSPSERNANSLIPDTGIDIELGVMRSLVRLRAMAEASRPLDGLPSSDAPLAPLRERQKFLKVAATSFALRLFDAVHLPLERRVGELAEARTRQEAAYRELRKSLEAINRLSESEQFAALEGVVKELDLDVGSEREKLVAGLFGAHERLRQSIVENNERLTLSCLSLRSIQMPGTGLLPRKLSPEDVLRWCGI